MEKIKTTLYKIVMDNPAMVCMVLAIIIGVSFAVLVPSPVVAVLFGLLIGSQISVYKDKIIDFILDKLN